MVRIKLKWAKPGVRTTRNEIAILIDVLRASTTITRALVLGAKWVMPVSTIEKATLLANAHSALLMGERKCVKIEGFDFGNSPLEISKQRVCQKRIVFTSTNFPKTLIAARQSPVITIGSILNITAVAEYAYKIALRNKYNICFMLAGTLGEMAFEDLAFVGAAGLILEKYNVSIENKVSYAMDMVKKKGLDGCILNSKRAKILTGLGFRKDVVFACKKDLYDIIPTISEWKGCKIFT